MHISSVAEMDGHLWFTVIREHETKHMEVKVKEKMRVIGNNLDTGILGVKCHIFNEPGVLVKDRLEC